MITVITRFGNLPTSNTFSDRFRSIRAYYNSLSSGSSTDTAEIAESSDAALKSISELLTVLREKEVLSDDDIKRIITSVSPEYIRDVIITPSEEDK